MPAINEQEIALAKVYSKAMLGLALKDGSGESLGEELNDLADYIDRDSGFEHFLSSPTIDPSKRDRLIEKLFRGKYSDLCVDSLQVLNRKERLGLIRAVAHTFHLLHEEQQGRIEVYIITATALTDELRSKLVGVLNKHTGKETDLIESVDESLIGGMVVRIGDEKFDMSVATKLNTMHESLLDRASRESHSGRSFVEGSAL